MTTTSTNSGQNLISVSRFGRDNDTLADSCLLKSQNTRDVMLEGVTGDDHGLYEFAELQLSLPLNPLLLNIVFHPLLIWYLLIIVHFPLGIIGLVIQAWLSKRLY